MGKLLAKIIAKLGGAKLIKNIVLDLLVKILVKDFFKAEEFAQEIHDAVQEKGRDLIGLARYERLERDALEPFAQHLLRLWTTDAS